MFAEYQANIKERVDLDIITCDVLLIKINYYYPVFNYSDF